MFYERKDEIWYYAERMVPNGQWTIRRQIDHVTVGHYDGNDIGIELAIYDNNHDKHSPHPLISEDKSTNRMLGQIQLLRAALIRLVDIHHRTIRGSNKHDSEHREWEDCSCGTCQMAQIVLSTTKNELPDGPQIIRCACGQDILITKIPMEHKCEYGTLMISRER